MNTQKTIVTSSLIGILVLIIGGLGGYFIGQNNKNQEVNNAKQAAAKEAADEAKANAQKALTKADADKTPQEKAPAKVATDTTCNADELTLTTEAAGGAAGTLSYNVILTNGGKRTCTLGGFPGVSLVNDNGNQVGSPAERATNYEEKKLTLAPGVKAMAVVSISNSSNFPDGQCKTGATKLRVYPPNDTGYLSVATTINAWCPGFMTSPVLSM